MIKKIIFLFLIILINTPIIAGKKSKAPGIDKLQIGITKKSLLSYLDSAILFSDCKVSIDTNTIYVSSPNGKHIKYKGLKISSIKCMFNKKKTVQALSIIFSAQIVDEVEEIYNFSEKMLGKPKSRSSKRIGFKLEADWLKGKYGATFFASDVDFEVYLLLSFKKFLKEEIRRGSRQEK